MAVSLGRRRHTVVPGEPVPDPTQIHGWGNRGSGTASRRLPKETAQRIAPRFVLLFGPLGNILGPNKKTFGGGLFFGQNRNNIKHSIAYPPGGAKRGERAAARARYFLTPFSKGYVLCCFPLSSPFSLFGYFYYWPNDAGKWG